MTSSNSNHLSKASPPNTITQGMRAALYKWGDGHAVHSRQSPTMATIISVPLCEQVLLLTSRGKNFSPPLAFQLVLYNKFFEQQNVAKGMLCLGQA